MRVIVRLSAVLVCGILPHAFAQDTTIVSGTVTDAATGLPLPEATVEVVGTSVSAQTDAAGAFRFEGIPLGAVALAVRRMGYRPVQFFIDLDEPGTFQIPAGQIALQPLPVGMPPVEVEAERAPGHPRLAEFYERRENNVGSFITREEFERMGSPQKPTDVLRRMAGVRVTVNTGRGRTTDNPWLAVGTSQWIVRVGRTSSRQTFMERGEIGSCPPLYFVDGVYIGTANQFDIDQILSLNEIEAVESYGSAATMPVQFNRTDAACGVIAFWTRR